MEVLIWVYQTISQWMCYLFYNTHTHIHSYSKFWGEQYFCYFNY